MGPADSRIAKGGCRLGTSGSSGTVELEACLCEKSFFGGIRCEAGAGRLSGSEGAGSRERGGDAGDVDLF